MTNLEYVNSIIRSNDMIYIDTSSLMNVMELRKFLESYYQIFVDYNKRIIVTREVCLEIYRHLISKVETKQYKSQKVIEVLKQYKEIFIFEDENLNDTEAERAFADSELLSRITKEKIKHRQLLITNDKKLSVDVYNLNNLNSCLGAKISVCYISQDGLLHKGKTKLEDNFNIVNNKLKEIKIIGLYYHDKREINLKTRILDALSGVIVGTTITKYMPKLIRAIR